MRSASAVVVGLAVLVASIAEARADGFDIRASSAALTRAAHEAKSCKSAGPTRGGGVVRVTFESNGTATSAELEGPPLANTPVGQCIVGVFRKAQIPAFTGAPVKVRKNVTID